MRVVNRTDLSDEQHLSRRCKKCSNKI